MKLAAVLFVAACGGSSKPAPKPEPSPTPVAKRIPIEEPEDSEPTDGVQVVSTKGHMEMSVIEAGLQPHQQSLADCYATRVGKRKWLGGRVSLHWDINKEGETTAVKLAESDLGAWPIEKCLLDIAREAQFGKPVGGDADFSIPLDFSAKGHPLSWDEDQSLRAVGGQLAGLDECADPSKAASKGKPKRGKGATPRSGPPKPLATKVELPDDVTVTVYVGPGGKAQSVGFASTKSTIDDGWAECAEKTAMAWRLPDPKGVIAKLAIRYRAN